MGEREVGAGGKMGKGAAEGCSIGEGDGEGEGGKIG